VVDLLEQSSVWLEDQREKFMSRTVIYQRPGSPAPDTVEVTATIGQTVFAVDNGEGAALQVESRDYLIRAAHLVLGGGPVLPRRGDRIREVEGPQVFVYEVTAPGNEPHWRYSDPYRRTLRIHTKQVDQEATP
jgi:hypothetical protein